MCNLNINGTTITLTQDQLDQIDRQRTNKYTLNDLNSYEDACKILSINPYHKNNYIDEEEYITHQLKTIIKAANYINNNNTIWIPDFNNSNLYKYIPYFEKKSSGWLFYRVGYDYSCTGAPVWSYFKVESTTKLIANRFNTLYNKYLG